MPPLGLHSLAATAVIVRLKMNLLCGHDGRRCVCVYVGASVIFGVGTYVNSLCIEVVRPHPRK